MTHFPQWRLDWIDDQLSAGDPINRWELVELFGITCTVASSDIKTFQTLYTVETPHGLLKPMRYDPHIRCYLPNRPFRSRRGSSPARRAAWKAFWPRPLNRKGVPK